MILSMLEDGRLHLCGIGVLSRHLNDANYEDVLTRATHKTKREIEILVAELDPKPDVPPRIRKRPQRKAKAAPPESANELCPDRVEQNAPVAEPEPPAAPEKPATVQPLSKARYKVVFTASEELRGKLKRLEALMPEATSLRSSTRPCPKNSSGSKPNVSARPRSREKASRKLIPRRVCAASRPQSSVSSAIVTGTSAPTSALAANVARSVTNWSSTTRSRMASAAIEAPRMLGSCVNYADIGIMNIMPTTRLCRVGWSALH